MEVKKTESTELKQMSKLDVAKFIEGLSFGILKEQFSDLDSCIDDALDIQQDLFNAMTEIEMQTWKHMKVGLEDLGKAINTIPVMMKDCDKMKTDLTKLIKISEILIHPFTLIFHAGKRLLLDGIDIFKNVNLARNAY